MRIPRLYIITMFVVVMLVSTVSDTAAWDGKRKGFVLGLGEGLGIFTPPYWTDKSTSGIKPQVGVHIDLEMGYAFSDKFMVHYSGTTFLYQQTKTIKWNYVSPSLAVTYYSKPQSPSLHFGGGFGFLIGGMVESYWLWLPQSASIGHLSIGYEVARHYDLELTVLGANFGSQYKVAWGFRVILMVVGY